MSILFYVRNYRLRKSMLIYELYEHDFESINGDRRLKEPVMHIV